MASIPNLSHGLIFWIPKLVPKRYLSQFMTLKIERLVLLTLKPTLTTYLQVHLQMFEEKLQF